MCLLACEPSRIIEFITQMRIDFLNHRYRCSRSLSIFSWEFIIYQCFPPTYKQTTFVLTWLHMVAVLKSYSYPYTWYDSRLMISFIDKSTYHDERHINTAKHVKDQTRKVLYYNSEERIYEKVYVY